MAKTHTKPGPKSRYGERVEIHVQVPKDDLAYIRQQGNMTEWIIQAIQEKRQRESTISPAGRYNQEIDARNQASLAGREKPWLPPIDGE